MNNCIGYHNYKAFLLFVSFVSLNTGFAFACHIVRIYSMGLPKVFNAPCAQTSDNDMVAQQRCFTSKPPRAFIHCVSFVYVSPICYSCSFPLLNTWQFSSADDSHIVFGIVTSAVFFLLVSNFTVNHYYFLLTNYTTLEYWYLRHDFLKMNTRLGEEWMKRKRTSIVDIRGFRHSSG